MLNDLATDTSNALRQVLPFVFRDITVTINDPSVTATLLNSWVAFGGSYAAPGYWKDSENVVHLFGAAKDGTYGASAVLTLPEGYRPAAAESFAVVQTNATFEPAGRLDVAADGTVTAPAITSVQTGTSTFLSLSGVSFRASGTVATPSIASRLDVNTRGLPGSPTAVTVVSCWGTVTTDAKACPSIAWQPQGNFVQIVDVVGLPPGTYTLRLLITTG